MRHYRIEASGLAIHAVEVGQGPAVILCHGFPAIWSSWRLQMLALAAQGYRAISLDMRGYGESDAPEDATLFTPFECVGDLIAIMDELGIRTAAIVGHDFGATVAWNAAFMRPDRFTAVFGISVPFTPPQTNYLDRLRAAGHTDFYMFSQMRPQADEAWADAATTIPAAYYWTSGQPSSEARWDPFDPARGLLRAAPEPLRLADPQYLSDAIANFSRTGFHAALNYYRAIDRYFEIAARPFAGASIRQPSFFMTGARDGLNTVLRPTEQTLRQVLPSLRGFLTVPEAGHWPQLETPEQVNRALVQFLSQQ